MVSIPYAVLLDHDACQPYPQMISIHWTSGKFYEAKSFQMVILILNLASPKWDELPNYQ